MESEERQEESLRNSVRRIVEEAGENPDFAVHLANLGNKP